TCRRAALALGGVRRFPRQAFKDTGRRRRQRARQLDSALAGLSVCLEMRSSEGISSRDDRRFPSIRGTTGSRSERACSQSRLEGTSAANAQRERSIHHFPKAGAALVLAALIGIAAAQVEL